MKAGSVGFELINQIDDSEMDRTGWESVAVLALVATRAACRHPTTMDGRSVDSAGAAYLPP